MSPTQLTIKPIKIYSQNYVWCIEQASQAWLVDPGLHAPVVDYLQTNCIKPIGIIVTHAHWDHINGIPGLLERYPDLPVLGPFKAAIPYQTHQLQQGDTVKVFDNVFTVLETPGHTQDHICLISQTASTPLLFCGDTLFSLGCGRTFSGSAEQLFQSISTLAKLPAETLVYCTHEYTRSNLQFAQQIEPDSADLKRFEEALSAQEAHSLPSLPSSIGEQLKHNPFMRCTQASVENAVKKHMQEYNIVNNNKHLGAQKVFKQLRLWKDMF